MPTHDIIDNRGEKLVDRINRILSSTEAAAFAVGYFFLSGLTCNGMTGHPLLKALGELCLQHHRRGWMERRALHWEEQAIPKIVCSEALV